MDVAGGMDDDVRPLRGALHGSSVPNVAGSQINIEPLKGALVGAGAMENPHLFADLQQAADDVVSEQAGCPGDQVFHRFSLNAMLFHTNLPVRMQACPPTE